MVASTGGKMYPMRVEVVINLIKLRQWIYIPVLHPCRQIVLCQQ